VRSFEAKPPNSQQLDTTEQMNNEQPRQGSLANAPLLIEEFYEYGGRAVCSNHVFNFKIGKWLSTNTNSGRRERLSYRQNTFLQPYVHPLGKPLFA